MNSLKNLPEKVKSVVDKLRKLDDEAKRPLLLKIALGIAFTLAVFFSGYISLSEKVGIFEVAKLPLWRYVLAAFFTITGLKFLVLISSMVTGMYFYFKYRRNELSRVKSTDSRGVDYSDRGIYGTAEWLSRPVAEEVYEIGDIKDVNGIILGQYTENGKETICLSCEDPTSNKNTLCLGAPGTGKSFSLVRNAVYQAIRREESIVITDPKGELYESMVNVLRENGYEIKVFNLVNPQRSDAWDCIGEIYDPDTHNISDSRVTDFADTVMKNTCDGPDDHFWGTGEQNLFKAIIMYCAWNREIELKAMYQVAGRKLVRDIESCLSPSEVNEILKILDASNYDVSMKERKTVIRTLAESALGVEKGNEHIEEINNKAAPCDMASIYYLLVSNDIKAFDMKFQRVPISHPAGIAWSIFKGGTDNTRPGFVQGLSQRLQLFQMRDIRRITTNKDIVLEQISEKKTALFCVISDKSTSMRALTSLFFTFLFKDISDVADRHGAENRLPVNVICDEFANLGAIPQFDVVISTVRSRKISIYIILQSIVQLEKVYESAAMNTIICCCDTILFLGCNDTETANFISDLSGIASIRVGSVADTRNNSIGNRTPLQGYKISEGDGKRNLLNPDEVRKIPKSDVIIYHNGYNVLQARRCGYIEHPFFKNQTDHQAVRLKNYPLSSEKYHLTEHLDSFVQGDVSSISRRNAEIIERENADKAISVFKGATDGDVIEVPTNVFEDVKNIPLKDEVGKKNKFNF